MNRLRISTSWGSKCTVGVRQVGPKRGKLKVIHGIERLEPRTLLSGLAWTPGPSLPVARADAGAVANYNGVLLLGGTTGSAAATASLELNPVSGAWVSVAVLNSARVSSGVGETGSYGPIVNGDYKYTSDVFVFGGASATGTPSSAVLNYDPTNFDNSESGPSMSAARSAFAYATDPATGDLYAIGGRGTGGVVLSSAELYDPHADAWSAIAPLPAAVYGATAAPDGAGHILVFGGDDGTGTPVDTLYRYTIATGTWDQMGAMPMAVAQGSAVYAAYGLIYLIGGQGAAGAVANVESYNPVLDTWSDEAALPEPVYGASAVLDVNGNIDVIGGHSASGAVLSDVWESPVGSAPVGLPVPPTLSLGYTWTTWNGLPQPLSPYAVGTDGVTPVAGTFDVTYDGAATAPTGPGTYNVVAKFTSADPGYVDGAITGTYVISPATPQMTVTGGGTITYDGQPHAISATVVGIDGKTPVAGTFAYTYNGLTTAPVNGGTYTAVATFTSADPDYGNVSASTTITIPDPTIPTGVTAVGASTTSIRLSWNPCPIAVAGYDIYERHVAHSPRGSGVSITYSLLASGITSTSVIIGVAAGSSHTYAVKSVSPSGVLSAMSALATGTTLSAPYLYAIMTSGGALTSYPQAQIGQTTTFTLISTGNLAPTFSMLSGPSGMSVNATTGVVTYTPLASDMGTVPATFVATNSVGSSQLSVQFQVLGLPTVQVTGGSFAFDGLTHAATAVAYGLDGVTPLAGTFTFAYAPVQYPTSFSSSPYAEPGNYIVRATFTSSDPAYGGAVGTGTLKILPAVPGTSGNDVITLSRDADGQHIDWTMGSLSDRVLITDPNGLAINGNGGNDSIILDYTNGNPLPALVHLNGMFTVTGLQGSSLPGVTLDIGSSTIYFNYDPSASPLAAIHQALAKGYNNGAWNGAASPTSGAIVTSVALVNGVTGIGYSDSTDGLVALPPDTIEVRQTIMGDANLDGTVNIADANQLSAHWNAAGSWDQGDFNYDGIVDVNDALILSKSFNATLPPPAVAGSTPSTTPTSITGSPTSPTTPVSPPATDPTDVGGHAKHRRSRRLIDS
jgi:hypothetical protein